MAGSSIIFGIIIIVMIIIAVVVIIKKIKKHKSSPTEYTDARDTMQSNLAYLFTEPGYSQTYNDAGKKRPTFLQNGLLIGAQMGDSPSGFDYVYSPDFFVFYNISDPNGPQDGNNAIYLWNDTHKPTDQPDNQTYYNGYNNGPASTNPIYAHNWLVDRINSFNQTKYTSDIYNQLKLSYI